MFADDAYNGGVHGKLHEYNILRRVVLRAIFVCILLHIIYAMREDFDVKIVTGCEFRPQSKCRDFVRKQRNRSRRNFSKTLRIFTTFKSFLYNIVNLTVFVFETK